MTLERQSERLEEAIKNVIFIKGKFFRNEILFSDELIQEDAFSSLQRND